MFWSVSSQHIEVSRHSLTHNVRLASTIRSVFDPCVNDITGIKRDIRRYGPGSLPVLAILRFRRKPGKSSTGDVSEAMPRDITELGIDGTYSEVKGSNLSFAEVKV